MPIGLISASCPKTGQSGKEGKTKLPAAFQVTSSLLNQQEALMHSRTIAVSWEEVKRGSTKEEHSLGHPDDHSAVPQTLS